MTRRLWWIVAVGVLVLVSIGAVLLVADGQEDRDAVACDELRFTPAGWSRARPAGRSVDPLSGHVMGEELVACDLLLGRTAATVRRLLGPPDIFGPYWAYSLGMSDSIGDDDFLTVEFGTDSGEDVALDSNRRVSKVFIP